MTRLITPPDEHLNTLSATINCCTNFITIKEESRKDARIRSFGMCNFVGGLRDGISRELQHRRNPSVHNGESSFVAADELGGSFLSRGKVERE